VRFGDFQIDSCDKYKECEFRVILKQEKEVSPLKVPCKYDKCGLADLLEYISKNEQFMVHLALSYGQCGWNDDMQLEDVFLQIQPLAVYVEDRLFDFLLPSLLKFFKMKVEQIALLEQNTTLQCSNTESEYNIGESESLFAICGPVFLKHDTIKSNDEHTSGKVYNGGDRTSKLSKQQAESTAHVFSPTALMADLLEREFAVESQWPMNREITIPMDISTLLMEFSTPMSFRSLKIRPIQVFVTIRLNRKVYLAIDHTALALKEFEARDVLTTNYFLGHTVGAHYTLAALFDSGNPLKLIGSLELLGSPGTFARSVGSGLKDFLVYPYQGIFLGPTGFVKGVSSGLSSLLKNVTSG